MFTICESYSTLYLVKVVNHLNAGIIISMDELDTLLDWFLEPAEGGPVDA